MSITGAALYGLLVLTNHFLTQEKPEFILYANDHALSYRGALLKPA